VAIDQEGGAVSRLRAWVGPTPPLARIWEQAGPGGCQAWGALWARGLALLGVNVDFAPVADLAGAALGGRSASAEPLAAARAAGAFLAGLEGAGVRGCLKHFPGLGGTALDSHLGLPELADPAALQRNALPFQMLAHPDRLVMVAHLKTPRTGALPASLSPLGVRDNGLGVTARFIPDDLEMGGCHDWDWEARVRLCLEAGHQALLVCQTPEGIALCAKAAEHQPRHLWQPAAERWAGLRRHLPRHPQLAPAAFQGAAWGAWVEAVKTMAGIFPS
jgi:beta-N-acetylhexosaminidase